MADFTSDFEGSLAGAFAALVRATKAAGRLPEDIGFHRTLDEDVDARLMGVSDRVMQMAQQLQSGGRAGDGIEAVAVDDVALQGSEGWAAGPAFRKAVDSVDTLLERIDAGLEGGRRAAAAGQGAVVSTTVRGAAVRMVHATNVARPQLEFADGVDNSPDTAFAWKIRTKPHARVALDYGLPGREVADTVLGRHLQGQGISRPGSPRTGGVAELPHPYEYEITHLEPAAQLFEARTAQKPESWDNTPFEFVDTAVRLQEMMKHLQTADVIAVDLEHHDYRSYQGFTCLVQISTRQRDYVVDALALRADLWQLNEVTADPQRVKVLHGAESDVVWLQRDFGVYLVGLLDTYHATKVLNMAHHSLAHLLRTYSGVDVDKKYQLADWRLRPVPAEMLDYARGDTHYLLHIFDCLRAELLKRGTQLVGCNVGALDSPHFGQLCGMDVVRTATQPMDEVLRRSSQTALRRYVKEPYDADAGEGNGGWARLLRKWRHPFTPRHLAVFRALHRWRDTCAREEDESPRYVLPNHMLFAIASKAPRDVAALLALCQPTPPLVRLHAVDIVALIAHEWLVADLRLRDADTLPGNTRPLSDVRPVHIRFDEPSSDTLRVADDVLSVGLLDAVKPLVSQVSGLFGTGLSAVHDSPATPTAELARDIRSNLVLSVAVPTTVVATTASPEPEFIKPSRRNIVSKPAEPQLSLPPQPVVLSESMAKLNTNDQNLSKIDLAENEEEEEHKQNQPRRKRPRKKKTVKSSVSPSPATVKPFDYSTTDAAEAIADTTTSAPAKKQRRKRNANFDPYSQISTSKELASPPSRTRVSSKSGNRTISYKK